MLAAFFFAVVLPPGKSKKGAKHIPGIYGNQFLATISTIFPTFMKLPILFIPSQCIAKEYSFSTEHISILRIFHGNYIITLIAVAVAFVTICVSVGAN